MRVHTEVDPITRVAYTVNILHEHTPVRGNAMASGNDAIDREAENEIEQQLADGNQWAWCTVAVTASRGEYEGTDYLGCCSYRDMAEFITPDGYYPDMKAEAYRRLLEAEQEANPEVAPK